MLDEKPIESVFVLRYETLAIDWRLVAREIDANMTLPQHNSSSHLDYPAYYDDDCMKIVEKLYAPEIYALGYAF